jgi:hypothetical protein
MDTSGQCSASIKALAEDFKTQAKARSYISTGATVPDEAQKDRTHRCIEGWAEELEELSEARVKA